MNAQKNAPAAGNSEGVEKASNYFDDIDSQYGYASDADFGATMVPDEGDLSDIEDSISNEPQTLEEALLSTVRRYCSQGQATWEQPSVGTVLNLVRESHAQWHAERDCKPGLLPRALAPYLVAEMILRLRDVRMIQWHGGSGRDDERFLAIYDPCSGIYADLSADGLLGRLVQNLSPSMDLRDVRNVHASLKGSAKHAAECADPNLLPMGNGVLNRRSRRLDPHSPDRVFVRKFPVRWVDNAPLPTIDMGNGQRWDPESWMTTLSDDPEVVEMLWEVIGALFRPETLRGRIVAPYGEGRNGKGTLRQLLQNLCGGLAYAPSLSLAHFTKEFALKSLIGAVAVLGDENAVNAFHQDAAALKSVATGDPVSINRKGQDYVTYTFRGLIFEPLNEYPKFADKSFSLFRRFLFVPMLKNFTGTERPEIKEDFLARPEVLEYVAHRVLTMEYEVVREPQAVRDLMADVREANDPVLEFWKEFRGQFGWDALPSAFVYDLYSAWQKKTNPSGRTVSQKVFVRDLNRHLDSMGEGWEYTTFRPGQKMADPEPLSAEYDLRDWLNPAYPNGPDIVKRTLCAVKASYRGWVRVGTQSSGATVGSEENSEEGEV